MRAALLNGARILALHQEPGGHEAWGWQGRTLGRPVSGRTPGWLRLASKPAHDDRHDIFWTGTITACTSIPAQVPRPQLHDWHEWVGDDWRYRAERYERVRDQPASMSATLEAIIDRPSAWWANVRRALDDIARVTTNRHAVTQQYLDVAMPRFLGNPIDTRAPRWATAHGDFHLANLCGPRLSILDWEGWGLAPTGYDAAMLHTYSLTVPTMACRIRHELRHLLDSPAGRFAELAVITELLHAATRGAHAPLVPLLRQRARQLLQRAVPGEGV